MNVLYDIHVVLNYVQGNKVMWVWLARNRWLKDLKIMIYVGYVLITAELPVPGPAECIVCM